jgi:hypothetical protein
VLVVVAELTLGVAWEKIPNAEAQVEIQQLGEIQQPGDIHQPGPQNLGGDLLKAGGVLFRVHGEIVEHYGVSPDEEELARPPSIICSQQAVDC